MSGHSYDSKCLNCDNDLNSYADNKPIDTVQYIINAYIVDILFSCKKPT